MDSNNTASDTAAAIEWARDVPMVTNRFILYDAAKMFAWTFGIMAVLMSVLLIVSGDARQIPFMLAMVALTTGGLALLFLLIMLLIFMNRFRMRMRVTEDGVSADSESRVGKTGNRLAIVLGLLAGRPGVAGAGMLGKASEHVGLRWDEVHRVNEYPDLGVLSVRNSWRVVLRLYCTPDNYAAVAAFVRAHVEAGTAVRRAREAREADRPKAPSQAGRRFALTLAVFAAVFCVTATPFEFDGRLLAACALLTLVGVWLPVGRVPVALVSLCVTLAIIGLIGAEGSRVRHLVPDDVLNGVPEPAWARYSGWSRLDGAEWMRLALTGAGLIGLAVVQALGLRRRKAPSPRA